MDGCIDCLIALSDDESFAIHVGPFTIGFPRRSLNGAARHWSHVQGNAWPQTNPQTLNSNSK